MTFKEVMDLWFVWAICIIVIGKYIKSVIDGWND